MLHKISTLLVTLGSIVVFSTAALYFHRNNPNRLSFYNIEEVVDYEKNSEVDRVAVAIYIADLDIRLPIIKAEEPKNRWNTTPDGVSYLSSSPMPGKEGNSVLYGHNWGSLLGNLVNAKPGMSVMVAYDNGTTEKFSITHTQEVSPKDTSILKPTKDSRLTLYTCSGFLDSKRFVVTAIKS